MYLNLFNGRKDVDDPKGGIDGPSLAITRIQGTYHTLLNILPKGSEDFIQLFYEEDLLPYNGMYYGDWSVTLEPRFPVEVF